MPEPGADPGGAAVPPRPLTILVADGDPANRALVEMAARRMGHRVLSAGDGRQALELYRHASPDLVFMDATLPGLDGIAAAARIHTPPGGRWVPVVHLTASDGVRGPESGDDRLEKPADPALVRARIAGYARLLGLQDQLRLHADELLAWRAQAEEENQLGHYVISRLVDAEGLRDPLVRWRNLPAQTFSGDLVCAARGPGEVLYLMLADAAGHGLPAALTALPLTQVFYGMTAKGFPIPSIAAELNRKLKALLPIDRFVATTLAAVDTRNRTIEVWNGGNPDVLFLDDEGGVGMRWASTHPPLGILSAGQFSDDSETFNYARAGELVLCSDGVVEAENAGGERLGLGAVEGLLRAAPAGRRFAALEEGLSGHLAGRRDHDDSSWLVVDIPLDAESGLRPVHSASPVQEMVSEWGMELAWGAAELRHVDVVPAVLGIMAQVQALAPHRSALFVIVSELFNNALDHGLLGLDSATKNQTGGIETYLEERARRLDTLATGRITMRFRLRRLDDRPALEIELADSGPGFDYAPYLATGSADPTNLRHGRGIRLVRAMCSELRYGGCGNQVYARYPL